MTYLNSPFKVSNVATVPSEFLTPFKYLSSPLRPQTHYLQQLLALRCSAVRSLASQTSDSQPP